MLFQTGYPNLFHTLFTLEQNFPGSSKYPDSLSFRSTAFTLHILAERLSIHEAQPWFYQSHFVVFWMILTVVINGNTYENHTREQVHSNSLRKEFAREVLSDSNFLEYKDPTNFRIRKFLIHVIIHVFVIILYRIHVDVAWCKHSQSRHGLETQRTSKRL